jgi:sugar lactone lactonase YvrE
MSPVGAGSGARAVPVLSVGALLGEGPVWDDRQQRLLFVDILGERIHWFHPGAGTHSSSSADGPVGAVVLREDGGLVLARHDCFVLAGPTGEGRAVVEGFRADGAAVRFNDGKVDPWGRFVAGTMDWGQSAAIGALHMLWPDGSVTTVLDHVTISNGLAWSAGGDALYYIDSPTKRVDAFDVDLARGALTRRRTVIDVGEVFPDGMAIDDDGCLWVAIWDAAHVRRYAPDGRLLEVVAVPEGGHVSSVAFGGPGMSTLYITTARDGLTEKELTQAPHAGDLFAFETSVTGPAPFRFAASCPPPAGAGAMP